MDGQLHVNLPPEWNAIKAVWGQSQAHFTSQGLPQDEAYALSMTIQELLENAVKYGNWQAGGSIGLDVKHARRHVSIEVSHPVDPDPVRLRKLDETIQWIRGFQDPFEAYVERLKTVSRQTSQGESGLGLVRIAYEGGSVLDFYVNDKNVLAVSAYHVIG